jgi:23S rRNA pseudouridine1911/1915/1917 synthase
MKEIFRYQVQQTERRKRLDEFLFERIGSLSKMHLRGLLNAGECLVNGIACQAGYRLETGDAIEIAVDLSARTSMKPEFIPLEILFEDDELMVIDKPAEMLVHPTKGVKSGTLLNALSFHLNHKFFESQLAKEQLKNSEQSLESNLSSSEFIRPGLVHRLDKQTSGLMVIAKNPRAHRILSDHFLRKLVETVGRAGKRKAG